ncbi:hypothetical protein VTO73DRAFT_12002 [Trametes versicolor]
MDAESAYYHVAANYYTFATSGLLVWHYLLTLDKEVEFFWGRGYSGARIMFFANRYLSIIWAIYSVSPSWKKTTSSEGKYCAAKASAFLVLEFLQYAFWAAFSGLRVYALRKQWAWGVLVFLLSIAPIFASATIMMRWLNVTVDPTSRCTVTLQAVIITRITLFMADVIVIAVTWMATTAQRAEDILMSIRRANTLSRVMFKNGALYFVALTTLNVLFLAFYAATYTSTGASNIAITFLSNFVETIYDALTTILTTNFLLKLQEASYASARVSSYWQTRQCPDEQLSVVQFARADVDHWSYELGSLPESVEDGEELERGTRGLGATALSAAIKHIQGAVVCIIHPSSTEYGSAVESVGLNRLLRTWRKAIVRPPYLTDEDIAYLFPRTAMRAMADVALLRRRHPKRLTRTTIQFTFQLLISLSYSLRLLVLIVPGLFLKQRSGCAYTILATFSVYVLYRGIAQRSSQILLSVVFALFISTAIFWTSTVYSVMNLFGQPMVGADPSFAYTLAKCAPTASLLVNTVLSDGIVWWRAWVISGGNRLLSFPAAACLVATCVLASVAGHHACTWVGPDGLPGEGEFFTGDPYGLAAATLSVLANIIATTVIGMTAWRHRQLIKAHLQCQRGRTLVGEVLLLLVESSVLYCLLWMFVFVGQVASVAKRGFLTIEYSYDNVDHLVSIDNAYAVWFRYVLQGIIPLIGVYPTLVILLVALKKSRFESHFSSPELVPPTLPVVFAPVSPSGSATGASSVPIVNHPGQVHVRHQNDVLSSDLQCRSAGSIIYITHSAVYGNPDKAPSATPRASFHLLRPEDDKSPGH